MLSRISEVLLVALLVMVTLGVAFQFQNQQLLRDVLAEVQRENQLRTSQLPQVRIGGTPLSVLPPSPQSAPAAPTYAPPAAPAVAAAPPNRVVLPGLPASQAPAPAPAAETVTPAAPPTAEAPAPAPPPATPAKQKQAPANAPVVAKATPPTPKAPPPTEPSPPPAPKQPELDPKVEAAWQAHGPLVTQIITDLLEGQYDRVVQRFDPTMAANLPAERVAQVMDPIRQRHGALKSVQTHEPLSGGVEPGLQGWKVAVEQTSGNHLEFWITLDQQNRIAGFFMK